MAALFADPSDRPGSRRGGSDLLRSLDWPTIVLYLAMVIAGVVSIYAASYDFDHASMLSIDEFSGKQVRWIGLGLIMAVVVLAIDARMYETYAFPAYVLMCLVLAATPFIAPDIKGSHSWIKIGAFSIQPAEFAKSVTALALAKLLSGYGFVLKARLSNYAKAVGLIFVPIVLILFQNETGSALTFMALFLVLYREGMSGLVLLGAALAVVIFVVAIKFTDTMLLGIPAGRFAVFVLVEVVLTLMALLHARHLEVARNLALWFIGTGAVAWIVELCGVPVPGTVFFLGTITVGCAYAVVEYMRRHAPKLLMAAAIAALSVGFLFSVGTAFDHLQEHQQMRIKVALGIEDDLRGAGYNVNQSKIAIGSGGIVGKGFLQGTQTKLKYVPEQHTDFIFCTIGEEEGFIGSVAVMTLFVLLILRVVTIAERQPGTFGRVYGYCVASYFIFHFAINIGMVIGLCPVIGIPLPFFSYGGSSLWGFTLLLFILLKLDASRSR